MKQLLKLCSLGLLLGLTLTTITAASYNYASSIASNGLSMSAYTSATNDSCSVSSKVWYISKSGKDTYSTTLYASKDPTTNIAHVSTTTTKLGASLITVVESTHKVGYNTYTSSAVYPK